MADRHREAIVTDGGDGSAGILVGIILGVIAVAAVTWFLFFRGAGGTDEPDLELTTMSTVSSTVSGSDAVR